MFHEQNFKRVFPKQQNAKLLSSSTQCCVCIYDRISPLYYAHVDGQSSLSRGGSKNWNSRNPRNPPKFYEIQSLY